MIDISVCRWVRGGVHPTGEHRARVILPCSSRGPSFRLRLQPESQAAVAVPSNSRKRVPHGAANDPERSRSSKANRPGKRPVRLRFCTGCQKQKAKPSKAEEARCPIQYVAKTCGHFFTLTAEAQSGETICCAIFGRSTQPLLIRFAIVFGLVGNAAAFTQPAPRRC